MNHFLGKFAAELSYTWNKNPTDKDGKSCKEDDKTHGLYGFPIHLRMAHNWKMASGVTFDSVQSFGHNLKSRDRLDFQVSP